MRAFLFVSYYKGEMNENYSKGVVVGLHIVLYEPEIARNTGNIMRTAVAVGATLHLIEPLGFDLNDKNVKRSATYHIPLLDYKLYRSYEHFAENNEGSYFFMTRHASKAPSDFDVASLKESEIYLIFGKESTGLPHELIKTHFEQCFRLPMTPGTKSLNVSNAVCVVAYEFLRQLNYPGLLRAYEAPEGLERESFDDFSR